MKYELSNECGHSEVLKLGQNCGNGSIDTKVFGKNLLNCIKELNELERQKDGCYECTIVCHGPGPNGECQPFIVTEVEVVPDCELL